jgi:hypothetical protein
MARKRRIRTSPTPPAGGARGRADLGTTAIRNPHGFALPDLTRDPRTGELGYREGRVTVMRALRDDPLARLHDRGQIGEAQYRAGRHWQALFEAAAVGRIAAIDPAKERVDGGNRLPELTTDRRQRAIRQLAALDAALGFAGKAIVRDVLGDGLTLAQVSLRHGLQPEKRTLEYFGRRLRECLDTLARELGYA